MVNWHKNPSECPFTELIRLTNLGKSLLKSVGKKHFVFFMLKQIFLESIRTGVITKVVHDHLGDITNLINKSSFLLCIRTPQDKHHSI